MQRFAPDPSYAQRLNQRLLDERFSWIRSKFGLTAPVDQRSFLVSCLRLQSELGIDPAHRWPPIPLQLLSESCSLTECIHRMSHLIDDQGQLIVPSSPAATNRFASALPTATGDDSKSSSSTTPPKPRRRSNSIDAHEINRIKRKSRIPWLQQRRDELKLAVVHAPQLLLSPRKVRRPPSSQSSSSSSSSSSASSSMSTTSFNRRRRPYHQAIELLEDLTHLLVPADLAQLLLAFAQRIFHTASIYAAKGERFLQLVSCLRRRRLDPLAVCQCELCPMMEQGTIEDFLLSDQTDEQVKMSNSFGADALFPIFVFCLIHARLGKDMVHRLMVIQQYNPSEMSMNELGYFAVVLESALTFCLSHPFDE